MFSKVRVCAAKRSNESSSGAFVAAQTRVCLWQAEQTYLAGREKQEVPVGELPAVHIAVVCGLNRKFYKQRNSQRPICDMQFTVVINESNRELRWQGASYSGAHPIFVAIFTIT